MMTSPLEATLSELVAVKVTSNDPCCDWPGVHEKFPESGSKMAPAGRLAADKTSGRPPGSNAEKVNATAFPKAVNCWAGRFSTGVADGVTITSALAEVLPSWTLIADGCCPAIGVATTLKLSSVWRGRDVIKAGTSRFGLLAAMPRRAIWGMLGEFNRTVQLIEPPAGIVSEEQATAVGRIPITERAVLITAPWTVAAICTCAS